MKKILILFVLLLISAISYSQLSRARESYYQNGFAILMKGQKEVVLDDMTRVDVLTDTFAIEVDFAEKWSQSVGQALFYAEKLNKKAGILLVVNGQLDEKYVRRLMIVAINHNITVWLMDYNTDNWCKVSQYYEYSYFFK
jgi:hypothetical protein